MEYKYKTAPFRHQAEVFEASWHLPAYGLFWEQGLGKSKTLIDTIACQWSHGRIDAAMVLCPKSMIPEWVDGQIPEHMPTETMGVTRVLGWQAARAGTVRAKRAADDLLRHDGLSILVVGYGSLTTVAFRRYSDRFMTARRYAAIADESSMIKSPGAARTRAAWRISRRAIIRRIASGTPVVSPFDLYAQGIFLDEYMWRRKRLHPFAIFRARFGVYERVFYGRQRWSLQGYQRLDELADIMAEMGSRRQKTDCLDLPRKTYSRRYFDLGAAQKHAYADIRTRTLLDDDGERTEMSPIVKLMRHSQVTSGYDVAADGIKIDLCPRDNPRIAALREILCEVSGQAIIWCRFIHDVETIRGASIDGLAVYEGTDDQRAKTLELFRSGRARLLVAKPSMLSMGVTLHCEGACSTAIYYTTSYSLVERLQSEDRIHRVGQPHACSYIDIVARGTCDVKVLSALRAHRDVAALITRDSVDEWI